MTDRSYFLMEKYNKSRRNTLLRMRQIVCPIDRVDRLLLKILQVGALTLVIRSLALLSKRCSRDNNLNNVRKKEVKILGKKFEIDVISEENDDVMKFMENRKFKLDKNQDTCNRVDNGLMSPSLVDRPVTENIDQNCFSLQVKRYHQSIQCHKNYEKENIPPIYIGLQSAQKQIHEIKESSYW